MHTAVGPKRLVGQCVERQSFQREIDRRGVEGEVLSEIEMHVEGVGEQGDGGRDLIGDAPCSLALIEAIATALDGVPREVVGIGEQICARREQISGE